MVDAFDLWKIPNRKLRHYMFNYLEIITVISTIMLIRSGTEENLEKKRELWKYIRETRYPPVPSSAGWNPRQYDESAGKRRKKDLRCGI